MARLIVITLPELANGYRLAGATTVVAHSGAEAQRLVAHLVDEPDVGVIGVHAPYWATFEQTFVTELGRRVLPVVVGLPTGGDTEAQERRARLAEMLRHAIGHRITFRREERQP